MSFIKKYGMWVALVAIVAYFAWKKFGSKSTNAGAKGTTTETGTRVPTVPTPYNAAAIKAKQDKFSAESVNDYLGAAGNIYGGLKGLFGGSKATGTITPSTSGSGTPSPLVYADESTGGTPGFTQSRITIEEIQAKDRQAAIDEQGPVYTGGYGDTSSDAGFGGDGSDNFQGDEQSFGD